MTITIGFLAAYGLLQIMNKLIGVKIGKGMPALWYCALAGAVTHLILSI